MTEYIMRYENEYLQLLPDKMQELVRCRDCEYCYFASNRVPDEQSHACEKHGIDVTPDWFCADGERKKGSWDYGTQCSVCKGTIIPPKDRKVRINFCPWCGADMRDGYDE